MIPIVIYNGLGAWGPPLELSELIERLGPSAEPYVPRLRSRLQKHVGPEEPELRRAFEGWLAEVIVPRLVMPTAAVPERLTLEELESMLAERIDTWNEKLREEGMQQGIQQGMQQGMQQGRKQGMQEGRAEILLRLLRKRFGFVDQDTCDRIAAADAELLLEWTDRFMAAESLAGVFGS